MKTNIILNLMLASSLTLLGACTSSRLAQSGEYDDMYFTSADRKKVQYADNSTSTNYASRNNQHNAPQNDAYYQGDNTAPVEQQAATAENQQDAYYDENYDGSRNVPSKASITNNYYGNTINTPQVGWVNSGFGFYNDPFYYADPFFYNPYAIRRSFYSVNPGLAFGFGWNSWSGWNMGMGMGMGYGPGWGMMHDPFWFPYGYSRYAYSSWGMPGMYGMYDPFWSPWGMNPYMAGYYNGYYDGNVFGGNRRSSVYAPRNDRSSVLVGGRGNAVNQGAVITGGRTTGRATNNDGPNGGAPNNGRNLDSQSINTSGRPSRGGVVAAPNTDRNMAVEPAEVKRAREVEIIRPERPSRTSIDSRPNQLPDGYAAPGNQRPATIERPSRPTRDEYYARPSRSATPANEQGQPYYSAPSRQTAPMMERSAPNRYESPSRPSRDTYSAPSRGSYSTPSYSTPSPMPSGGSYSSPSRGSSSPAPSGGRPSRGGGM